MTCEEEKLIKQRESTLKLETCPEQDKYEKLSLFAAVSKGAVHKLLSSPLILCCLNIEKNYYKILILCVRRKIAVSSFFVIENNPLKQFPNSPL